MDTPIYIISVSGNDPGDVPPIQFAAVPQLLNESSAFDNEILHTDLVQLHDDFIVLHNDFNILIGTLLLIVTMYFVMTIRSKLFSRRKK